MAKTDRAPIYKTKIREGEQQEAKKGDTKEFDGEEHESIGILESERDGPTGARSADMDEKDQNSTDWQRATDGGTDKKTLRTEFWRKKRKKAVDEEKPTS